MHFQTYAIQTLYTGTYSDPVYSVHRTLLSVHAQISSSTSFQACTAPENPSATSRIIRTTQIKLYTSLDIYIF